MDGCITRERFDKECEQIIKRSAELKDNFTLESSKHDEFCKYLCKHTTKIITVDDDKNVYENDEMGDSMNEEDVPVDKLSASVEHSDVVNFKHHIVYSDSYNVPVCILQQVRQIFFCESCLCVMLPSYVIDGRIKTLEEIWQLVPEQQKHALQDKWSFITQQEHPYLQIPCYQLHPCHTSNFMKALSTTNSNYLLMWISAIGPVVNLNLPMAYFHSIP
ncbi:ubiquitin-like-conjugating enzyme ATG10 [Hydractinia symbiolongicarpus]|uniref:ubiquitin-like-conjugating enzyme ATG10 n=1 Tax=Hydractinia symbiolongicarpus TaxID=13093 RepID=UPI00254B85F8|nr:ubiquitin-like-conjugating enzyme ATG10 [Hydractinia symbiolongicarpus]